MRKATTVVICGLVVAVIGGTGVVSLAADKENSESVTQDTSENPFTGTKTTTTKRKFKKKAGHGVETEVNQKETIKEKTDGHVERKVETEIESEHKN